MLGCGQKEAPPGSEELPRKDIILISIDTLRADHLSCYGYDLSTSPNIDRLAADGSLYEYVVSSSAYTSASMASVMTGAYPRFNSLGYSNTSAKLLDHEVTLAEQLNSAGYNTAAFVCNPVLKKKKGFHQGFELYDLELEDEEAIRGFPERTAAKCTTSVLQWLGDSDPKRPLFLWVHYQDPHGPYTPPSEFADRFTRDEKGPLLDPPIQDDNFGFKRIPSYQAIDDNRHLQSYVSRYDSEIAFVDHHIGRLLDWFRENGRYEDATILLTSDHGEAFGENDFFFVHGQTVTKDQSFVPLLLKQPGQPGGRRHETPVAHIDIYPTLCAAAGLAPTCEGKDLGTLTNRNESPERINEDSLTDRSLYCDIGGGLAIHRDGFLLIGTLKSQTDKDILSLQPSDFKPRSMGSYLDQESTKKVSKKTQRRLMKSMQEYLSRPPARFASYRITKKERAQLEALGYSE